MLGDIEDSNFEWLTRSVRMDESSSRSKRLTTLVSIEVRSEGCMSLGSVEGLESKWQEDIWLGH